MAKMGPPPKRSTKGTPSTTSAARPANLDRPESGNLKPLNFKVRPAFHLEFKTYASSRGMSMLELLEEGFRLVKERHGS